jgi:hypothetical protein
MELSDQPLEQMLASWLAATSQPQDGAGAGSQHVGAASQQAALWKRPAEAVDEKLTAMAAIAREAIKRMDFSPKYQSKFP